jgi:hypothetical protein
MTVTDSPTFPAHHASATRSLDLDDLVAGLRAEHDEIVHGLKAAATRLLDERDTARTDLAAKRLCQDALDFGSAA